MKNILLILFYFLFFSSCDSSLDNFQGAQITYMNSYGSYKCQYQCNYKIGIGYETIAFVDSCGKYKIGDTVYLKKLTH